jgi:hypothetical protein
MDKNGGSGSSAEEGKSGAYRRFSDGFRAFRKN